MKPPKRLFKNRPPSDGDPDEKFATFAREQAVEAEEVEECLRFIKSKTDVELGIGYEYAMIERRSRERETLIAREMIRRHGSPSPAEDSEEKILVVAADLGILGDVHSDVVFVHALDAIRLGRAQSN